MLIYTFNFFLYSSHTSCQSFKVRLIFTFEPFFGPLFYNVTALVVDNFDFATVFFFLGIHLLVIDNDDLAITFFNFN